MSLNNEVLILKKYIIFFIIIVSIIGACFYLVFNNDKTLTVTYIKFKVNPEFVIGINNQEKVIMYNPLNDEAKVLNLNMLNEKSLEEACKIIINKLNENNYMINNIVDITIMTKNLEKENNLYNKVKNAIINQNSNIKINLIEPTSDELLSYSNETVYDLIPTFNDVDLQSIGQSIKTEIDYYVKEKINNLKISKLSKEKQIEEVNNYYNNGYFNDYVVHKNRVNGYDIKLSKRSSYSVIFNYNEDFTYSYNIILKLEFNNYLEENIDEIRRGLVENYKYTYNEQNEELISNYKIDFYRFIY